MEGTYTDILSLAKNLNAKGFELDKVRDADKLKTPAQPPQSPAGGSGSGSAEEDSMRAWVLAHHNNAPGNIQVQISAEHGHGPVSDWTDPVDVNGSGLAAYMAKHAS